MKIIRIKAWTVGLVFRNGALRKVLKEGLYFLSPADEVSVYDMTQPFYAPCELNILLQNDELTGMLQVITVKDNELAFCFENEVMKGLYNAGRYAFWKGPVNRRFLVADLDDFRIHGEISPAILGRKEVAGYVRGFTVDSWEKGVLMVEGRPEQVLEPGNYSFWKNNTVISVLKADMRAVQMEIAGQEILTRDKASLRLNAFVQYRVSDVLKALALTREFEKQLYVAIQLTLREYVGNLSLDELLQKKEAVADSVRESVSAKAGAMGLEILGCGIRDVILPGDVKEIMNQVLIAEKKAQANIIMRREETASTRSLLNTAKLMEDNQMLCRLKEMEYMEKIAEKISNISLNGGSMLADQLRQIFVPERK